MAEQVKTPIEAVEEGSRPKQCPNAECRAMGQENFWRNGTRERSFLNLVEHFVVEFRKRVQRYKCKICKRSFTQLPAFALPYKRYVKPTILKLSQSYLAEEEATYRSVVKWLGYTSEDGQIDERVPSHSRTWYWLETLGQMRGSLRRAKGLIRAKDPSSPAVGRAVRIPPRKYQSEARRQQLETAWSILQAEAEFVRLFGISLFPEFGTSLA